MIEISENFPGKIQTESCVCGQTESMIHLYKCEILSGGKQIDGEYETIFTGTVFIFYVYKYTFTCPRCGKVLHSKLSLTAHIETVHEKLKKFSCEFCTKAYTRKSDLKVHVTRKHK